MAQSPTVDGEVLPVLVDRRGEPEFTRGCDDRTNPDRDCDGCLRSAAAPRMGVGTWRCRRSHRWRCDRRSHHRLPTTGLCGVPRLRTAGVRTRVLQSQPRQTASLCCIRDQPRQFRTLLRDFRRPCPCGTHRLHPPIEPPLGPTHQFRRSKKLLPRHHFHDPPPDGSIRRLE
jgi:hypothetical protein